MLLLGLTTLLMAVGFVDTSRRGSAYSNMHLSSTSTKTKLLSSSSLTPTLLTRITSVILLFSAALSFNALYVQAIGSGLGLYSGLFHVTSVTQAMEVFLLMTGAFILLPWARSDNSGNTTPQQTMVPSIPEYPLIILFTTIGACFLISSCDLVSMYLSIELQSFAVYILAAIYRNSESATAAGLKYFLLGALSSALILLGSSLIYAYTGLTSFEGIYGLITVDSAAMENYESNSITQGVVLGVLIIAVGFLFKVAAAPFHNWAPDVYDGVPTIVTTWLTVMPKLSIFVFLLELQVRASTSLSLGDLSVLSGLVGSGTNVWMNLLLSTALLSLVIGTVVGLAQYRLKRLLAFSTISHVGFLLLALSVNSEDSITGFLFYLVQYSITNLDAFFVVLALGYVIHNSMTASSQGQGGMANTDISLIEQLKGQFHANPVLGLSLAICLFSMAGIPPLVGFFAKYSVLYAAIENGNYFLALVGILTSVVSAAYYLRIIRVIHFDVASDTMRDTPRTDNVLTSTHSYIIAVLTLLIALYILSPSLLLNSSNLLALSLFTA